MDNKRNEIRAKLSILGECSLKSRLENKRKRKIDLSNKNNKTGNLLKVSEQRTLNSLNTLGKFIRRAFMNAKNFYKILIIHYYTFKK